MVSSIHTMVHFAILYVSIIFSIKIPSDGEDFVDRFEGRRHDLWSKNHQTLQCIGIHCFLANSESITHVHGDDDAEIGLSYANFVMKNDCLEPACCFHINDEDKHCTQYTGGKLNSIKRYTYGSFRFLALSEGWTGNQNPDWVLSARYCFSLMTVDYRNNTKELVRISLCTYTQYSNTITIVWEHGDRISTADVHLKSNLGKTLGVMRIDWTKEAIKFYVRKQLIGTIDAKYKYIPENPVRISISLIPDDMLHPPANSTDLVQVNLHLYRVRYIKFKTTTDVPEHTELFTKDNHSSHNIYRICTFGIPVGTLLFVIIKLSTERANVEKPHNASEGHYQTLNP